MWAPFYYFTLVASNLVLLNQSCLCVRLNMRTLGRQLFLLTGRGVHAQYDMFWAISHSFTADYFLVCCTFGMCRCFFLAIESPNGIKHANAKHSNTLAPSWYKMGSFRLIWLCLNSLVFWWYNRQNTNADCLFSITRFSLPMCSVECMWHPHSQTHTRRCNITFEYIAAMYAACCMYLYVSIL